MTRKFGFAMYWKSFAKERQLLSPVGLMQMNVDHQVQLIEYNSAVDKRCSAPFEWWTKAFLRTGVSKSGRRGKDREQASPPNNGRMTSTTRIVSRLSYGRGADRAMNAKAPTAW